MRRNGWKFIILTQNDTVCFFGKEYGKIYDVLSLEVEYYIIFVWHKTSTSVHKKGLLHDNHKRIMMMV